MRTLPGDLALKHLLQNGLTVVRGDAVDVPRREDVLRALVQLFSDANRGSQALSARRFLVATNEAPAFQRFVLFFKHLDREFGDELAQRLSEAASVIEAIQQGGQQVAVDARQRTADLISALLNALSRESALKPLVPQRSVVVRNRASQFA